MCDLFPVALKRTLGVKFRAVIQVVTLEAILFFCPLKRQPYGKLQCQSALLINIGLS
tara:strand:+ start:126 stop:296 length:171 start_codon:yes stop_codon:yes gene_type:complete